MSFIRRIKYFFRRRELGRLGFQHVVANGRAWVEGHGGWRVEHGCSHPADPEVLYWEGSRRVCLDAYYWNESKEDREADLIEMSSRELSGYWDRMIFRVIVPDVMRWKDMQHLAPDGVFLDSGEAVTPDERERILNNIQLAVEFECGRTPQFVK